MQLQRVSDIVISAISFVFFSEDQIRKIAKTVRFENQVSFERKMNLSFDRVTKTVDDAVRPQLRIHLMGKGKSNSAGIE